MLVDLVCRVGCAGNAGGKDSWIFQLKQERNNLVKNQLKAGAALTYITLLAGNIIGLLYTPFLLRILGQSEYGLYSLANAVVGYLTVLDIGFGSAAIRYTAKYKAEGNIKKIELLHGMFLILYGIIGCFVFITGCFVSCTASTIFSSGLAQEEIKTIKILLILSSLNLAVSFPFGIFSSIITAYERFVFLKTSALIRLVINPLVFIPILIFGYKSTGLIIAATCLNIIFFSINWWYCSYKLNVKVRIAKPDTMLLKEIAGYSFWVFVGNIVNKLWWNSGQLLLGIFSTTSAIAIYGLAIQLKGYFESFAAAISSVFLPKLTAMDSRGISNSALTDYFIKVGRLQYLIISLIFTGFILFGKLFIVLWVGQDYIKTYYTTVILFIPLALIDTQTLGITILQAKNKHAFRSVLYLCIAIVCIILCIPLIKLYGVYGCAVATAIALIIGNLLIMNWFYHKKIGLHVIKFWIELVKMTPGMIMPVLLTWLLLKYLVITTLTTLLLCMIVYSLVYTLFLYFFSFNKYEKSLIEKIIPKFIVTKGIK
jgi:O-antigen/teichoic acid export membrane protein